MPGLAREENAIKSMGYELLTLIKNTFIYIYINIFTQIKTQEQNLAVIGFKIKDNFFYFNIFFITFLGWCVFVKVR